MFIQTMYGIRDVHKSDIKEEDFSEVCVHIFFTPPLSSLSLLQMIPIESFEAQSMTGKFVPIVTGGTHIKLTYQNRKEYVEKALHFRLHELDKQAWITNKQHPLWFLYYIQHAGGSDSWGDVLHSASSPLFTLHCQDAPTCCLWHGTGRLVYAEESSKVKKKFGLFALFSKCAFFVLRYKDGTNENHEVVRWLWQTLESFSNEERILFLRFVSGRSRLPVRISDIPHRFRISVYGQVAITTSYLLYF